MLYIGPPFLYKWAVVCGTRHTVGVGEYASTNAFAGFDIHGNRLKQLVRTNDAGSTGGSPLVSFSYHKGPRYRGTKDVPLM
jgi:hypothetical protein